MPWKALLNDAELQKSTAALVLEVLKLLVPLLNTIRLHRLERRVDAHHAQCKDHRTNRRIHN